MRDVALVREGIVVQVWRDHEPRDIRNRGALSGDLVAFTQTPVTCGQLWDGEKLVDPPPPPPKVPDRVEKVQLVRVLREAGQWDAVKAALAQADEATREDWDMAQVIRRADPLADFVATAAQLDDAALDELFRDSKGV